MPNQAVGSTLLSEIYAPIAKPRDVAAIPANLSDYQHIRDTFGWDAARELLNGLPDGRGLNIAHEAVDRHAESPRADRDALRWIGRDGARRSLTYRQLKAATNQFANALRGLGAREGDVVFVMAGRILELYIAALGALKAKCVVSPLFSAFGPEPIATRVSIGAGRFLVTTNQLYRRKIAQSRARLRTLEHVIVVSEAGENAVTLPGTLDWRRLVDTQSPDFVIPPTAPEDRALLHFTSGTTGRPKGAIHVHEAVVTHHVTGFYALDPHDDETWGGCVARLRSLRAAIPGQRRGAAQSGGGSLGPTGVWPAIPRQLVADRDWRDHDRQLRVDGREVRLDGKTAARHRRRHRAP